LEVKRRRSKNNEQERGEEKVSFVPLALVSSLFTALVTHLKRRFGLIMFQSV